MVREAEIKLRIKLDDKNFPEEIKWEATDSGFDGEKSTEAILLSLWDAENKNTLSIDLWTNNMLVDDMSFHFYQTFLKMADTYQTASTNAEAGEMIREFAYKFAEKLELTKKNQ